jgi:hypothetical protein
MHQPGLRISGSVFSRAPGIRIAVGRTARVPQGTFSAIAALVAGIAGCGFAGCDSGRRNSAIDAGSQGGRGGLLGSGGRDGAGSGGSAVGSGGSAAGSGGSAVGSGGSAAGSGGSTAGSGGSAVGSGGSTPGSGGSMGGTGGSAGASGGSAGGRGGGVGTGGLGAGTAGSGAGGQASAQLSPPATPLSFGDVEIGTMGSGTSWTVRNTGSIATGIPLLTNSNAAEVIVGTNGCTAALGPGAMCSIAISFRPSAGGARSGTLTLSATPGGSVTLSATANGQYRLTVTKLGGGTTSTVTSTAGGLSCGTSCFALVNAGTVVTLQARTTNGSNFFFSGWGGGCSGVFRDCAVTVNASTIVGATFSPMTHNLIFATAAEFATNRGSAAAYDADCNTAATAAGINDTPGTGYIAFVSDTASLATSRLGAGARGWVRTDGKPFADTQASLFTNGAVLHAIQFDETGRDIYSAGGMVHAIMMTGATLNGSVASLNCTNWTSVSETDFFNAAMIMAGPPALSYASGQCSRPSRLLCMGRTKTAALPTITTSGSMIWITNTPFTIGGGLTPDQKCQSERPTGVANAMALVATTARTAASVLNMTATYVRPDGVVVGTGAVIAAGGRLESGIWQSADLVYRRPGSGRVWTGQQTLGGVGTVASTCGDWMDTTLTAGNQGVYAFASPLWWRTQTAPCNNSGADVGSLYCVAVP